MNRTTSIPFKKISLWAVSLSLFLSLIQAARTEESHPGMELEAIYTEALLEYSKHHIPEAAKLLDEVLNLDPRSLPALEMRALTLKAEGNDARSIEIYTRLIQIKPEAEQGPYHYELATIYNKNKNSEKTLFHLKKCIALKFNEIPARLLLGALSFEQGDYALADDNLDFAQKHAPDELRMLASYYLGLVHFKMNYGTLATAEIIEARSLAENDPENPGAKKIQSSAQEILKPFQKSRWFANFSSFGQYDSNIAQTPIGISNPIQLSGTSTPRLNLATMLGWMSSPLDRLQWVGSYAMSLNKNTNSQTQNLEFFTHTASAYLNYRPLALLSGGFKIEGNYMFQNQLSAGSPNTYLYTKSSASLELGPFLKTFVNRSTQLEASLYFRPQVSYLYPTQNGAAGGIRAKITSQTVKKLLNPGWNLVLERTNAAGTDFNSMTYGTGISNLMRFSSQDTLTASIDVLLTNYFESSNHRKDVNLPLRISWSRFLTAQWTLMCDFNYITNLSTVSATYSYNRLLAGLGIAWAI